MDERVNWWWLRHNAWEISLAHNGILFLDEIAEFSKKTLDALRQPMEDRKVTISRVQTTNTFPANFMLVAAMNLARVAITVKKNVDVQITKILKYRNKLSGPILDRIDTKARNKCRILRSRK
ncbi:ATP-binding protein [Anaerobacillus sp. HL2]|nr:ATP-binding protein [Anaerobacillus sp. HL2]